MKLHFFSFVIIVLLTLFMVIAHGSETPSKLGVQSLKPFQIVFGAEPQTVIAIDSTNTPWLVRAKNDYHATGINLYVRWCYIELAWQNPRVCNYTTIDTAITAIITAGLNLYLRINFASRPTFVDTNKNGFTSDDFHYGWNDSLGAFTLQLNPCHCLNYTSQTARETMLWLYGDVCTHVDSLFTARGWNKGRLKEIVPVMSPDAETEFSCREFLGYSQPERQAFRDSMESKYGTIQNLIASWGEPNGISAPSTFEEIDPCAYNWHQRINYADYNFPKGRIDWMEFRTQQLKSIIDAFAAISDSFNFRSAIQLGCTFDKYIEKRGWYDPTSLLEHVQAIRVAPIAGREASFKFEADYCRSICKYWKTQNGNGYSFSSESNWPGYHGLSSDSLCQVWTYQLNSFYDKGADAHFVHGWGYDYSINFLIGYMEAYSAWRNALGEKKNRPVQSISYSNAVHLSAARGAFTHAYDSLIAYPLSDLEFYISLLPESYYTIQMYNDASDIISDYMITRSPLYLNNYTGIYFTRNSEYMADTVYKNLMKDGITPFMANATHDSTTPDTVHHYECTMALINEHGDSCKPLPLIWRSRGDLMALFPDANKPHPDSSRPPQYDFVHWAVNWGNEEYPGLNETYACWDKNVKQVWDMRPDLQITFPDGYHHYIPTSLWTLLEWARDYGYLEYPDILVNYNNWPYIGDNNDNHWSHYPDGN